MAYDTVILDLDGTLVDSVYQHVVAWQRAFHRVGLRVAGTEVHAAIGMGGDRLVAHVAGDAAEWAVGDQVRKLHDEFFRALLSGVDELDGATELLERLATSHRLVLASSGEEDITEELLDRVAGRHVFSTIVSGSEVEESKPAPDLLRVAAQKVGSERALVVGDSIWDMVAAQECGFASIGVGSGGTGSSQLLAAGAMAVYDGPRDLLTSLESTPLG